MAMATGNNDSFANIAYAFHNKSCNINYNIKTDKI